jgi:hypothetical protein
MFYEFFVRDWIRPKLFLYAVSHTLVAGLFSLALFVSLSQSTLLQLPSDAYFFSLVSWFCFTLFEVARKTYSTNEERVNVDSYSSLYGRQGAVGLLLVIALGFSWFIDQILVDQGYDFWIGLFLILLVVSSLPMIMLNRSPWGMVYRSSAFCYLAFMYIMVLVSRM